MTTARAASSGQLEVRPVTAERWPDLVELFGERGAVAGCWCMWFRNRSHGSPGQRQRNRAQMEALVAANHVPGLLAYRDGQPVGWVSLGPRRVFERIAGPDEESDAAEDGSIWSVVCFYIKAGQRGQGVASALLEAAVEHARRSGARILEAYPVEAEQRIANPNAYTGLRSMFERAGFREVGRFDRWRAVTAASAAQPKRLVRPPGRPVMQLEL